MSMTIDLQRNSKIESIVWDKRLSNHSIIEKKTPKRMSFSDFICTFAMSFVEFSCLLQHWYK